jgi:hypothetical protein
MAAIPDPARWTALAHKARALADSLPPGERREAMLDVATAYDRLAQQAEELREHARLRSGKLE